MAKRILTGITEKQRVSSSNYIADIRPTHRKLLDWMHIKSNMVVLIGIIGSVSLLFPSINMYLLGFSSFLFLFCITRKETAPIKMPKQSAMMDSNQPHPATGAPTKAEGIFFLGNDLQNGKEVWLTNSDCRQHFLVLGTTGAGKSIPKSVRVHTPTGWKTMGEVKVGDRVSTPDGRSAQILGYYDQGELDVCRITFEDGRTLDACPEHLWEIHHKHWTPRYKPGVSRAGSAQSKLLKTREIHELLARNKGSFYIALPEAVEKPASNVPLDPYLLGALLGDGNFTQKTLRFSSVDAENLQRVGETLPSSLELHHYDSSTPCDWNIRFKEKEPKTLNPVRSSLEQLGLFECESKEKFIPSCYKESSISQRWSIIQGLMDTDGSCDSRKVSLTFSTSSERLAKDFQEIVRSLGGTAKISRARKTTYTYKGEKHLGSDSWRVSIRHPEPSLFFSLSRKEVLADRTYQYSENLKLRVTRVEMNVRKEESACILIDHPEHLFIAENYVVTHNTETLLGFAANALSWSSGFLFCDGKGDVALYAKAYAMTRRFGREDDFLVLNFMTGNQDVGASGGKIKSNTMNPFSTGSSDGLTQMVVSLMDDVGGDGAMWKGRATAMLTGVMRALVWLRSNGHLDLNVGAIRDHMSLKKIIELSDESKNPDLPAHIRKSIKSYLSSLPGYQEEKREKQAQTTLDQHGYLEMQFTKILGSLADVYGHIFSTPYGEVDMYDVVLNRRILIIMLPALEKAQDEIANLGKIVVATLKGMMGATLGSVLEGNWEDIVENRPTTSSSPFLVVLDEVGYYTVEGMALMAAQARSLGFGMIYASQDIPAMKKLNDKEAASIIANTNTKIFMRTEEVDQTGKLAVDTADKGVRVRTQSFERDVSELGVKYNNGAQAGFEETNIISFGDLKAQGEGEMHIIFQDKVVRARGFYANPENSLEKTSLNLRANHFIKVKKPNRDELESARRAPELMAKMADPEFSKQLRREIEEITEGLEEAADSNDEIALVATSINKFVQVTRPIIDIACAAVANVMHKAVGATDAFQESTRAAFSGRGGEESRFNMPGLADIDFDDGPMRDTPPRGRVSQGFDDFEASMGSPFSDAAHPKAPARRKMPVNSSKVDRNVRHGIHVDDSPMFDIGKDISTNDSLMKSLAALDFDGDRVTSAQINAQIEESLNSQKDLPEPAKEKGSDKKKLNYAIEALDRAKASISNEEEKEEDGKGKSPMVAAFLEQLLSEEDDD